MSRSQRSVPSGLEDLLDDHFSYLENRSDRTRTNTLASINTADTTDTFDSQHFIHPDPEPQRPELPETRSSDSSGTTLRPPSNGAQYGTASRHFNFKSSKPDYFVHSRPVRSQSSGSSSEQIPTLPPLPPAAVLQNRSTSFLIEEKQSEPERSSGEKSLRLPSTGGSSAPEHNSSDDHVPLKIGFFHEICFIAVVACSHLMTQAALGQALAPMTTIGATFGTKNLGDMTWFIACYSLTVGTFILVSGRIGDIMGHKKVFVFGYAWLGMWAAFCGFAAYTNKQTFFDFCRAMQGIGPALLMPNGLALFGRAYPVGIKKNIVFSIFGAVAPMGFVLGSCSGSVFSEYLWWPWSFWTYGITAFFLGTFALLVIPDSVGSRIPNPPSFDTKGAFSGVAGLVLINVAWNQAPLEGWSSPHVYFLLIIGLLIISFFFYIETRVKDPLLPIKELDSSTGFVLACVGLGWGAFSVWLFYTYRFLMEERLHSPLSVTAQFGPAVLTGLLAAGLTGFMLTHTPVSFTMMISMAAFFTGTCIGGTARVDQSYWAQTFVSIFIMPFGMDMSFPAATVILSNHMPKEHQGLAASLVNTVVNYGIATALGVAGTVEINVGRGDNMRGIRSGFYTAMAMSGVAVLVGLTYFVKTVKKEGWKLMAH